MNAAIEQVQQEAQRPWPVVLLTSFGAWLAALPLMFAVDLLLGDVLMRGPVPYFVAALAGWQSIVLLRARNLPVFVEQLAVPLLLMGAIALERALYRDMPDQAASMVMAATSLGVAFFIPQAWLRTVLGVAGCAFSIGALAPDWGRDNRHAVLVGMLGVAAFWLAMQWILSRRPLYARLGSLADGWVLATLAGLAFWSGMTFLAGASMGGFDADRLAPGVSAAMQSVSLLLALAAAGWLARCWSSMRKGWCTAAAAAVMGLAWLMPSLGPILLIAAICATQLRWGLTAAAGAAAAWTIGAFYYQLDYPLATKALIMVAAGVLTGAAAWIALRASGSVPALPASSGTSQRSRIGIALCALVVLAVANTGIWKNETLIAQGKPVFIELAPVDPRSLMQGDYMRLRFKLPQIEGQQFQGAQRPHAVGKIDARGVLTLQRVGTASALAPGEIAVELTRAGGSWTVATDAWYFKEGGGARLTRATYGEFRVAPDGRALLVGLRGPQLEALTP